MCSICQWQASQKGPAPPLFQPQQQQYGGGGYGGGGYGGQAPMGYRESVRTPRFFPNERESCLLTFSTPEYSTTTHATSLVSVPRPPQSDSLRECSIVFFRSSRFGCSCSPTISYNSMFSFNPSVRFCSSNRLASPTIQTREGKNPGLNNLCARCFGVETAAVPSPRHVGVRSKRDS